MIVALQLIFEAFFIRSVEEKDYLTSNIYTIYIHDVQCTKVGSGVGCRELALFNERGLETLTSFFVYCSYRIRFR